MISQNKKNNSHFTTVEDKSCSSRICFNTDTLSIASTVVEKKSNEIILGPYDHLVIAFTEANGFFFSGPNFKTTLKHDYRPY